MSDIAIRAKGLSKLYRIGQQERENALRNVLGPMLRAPWKLLKRMVMAGWYGRKSGRGFYDYADPNNPKANKL